MAKELVKKYTCLKEDEVKDAEGKIIFEGHVCVIIIYNLNFFVLILHYISISKFLLIFLKEKFSNGNIGMIDRHIKHLRETNNVSKYNTTNEAPLIITEEMTDEQVYMAKVNSNKVLLLFV